MKQTNIPAPFEDSYWVVPGKLLAGYFPETTRGELRPLFNIGVSSFIDLTQKNEGHRAFSRISPYSNRLYRLANEYNLPASYKRFPVRDMSVPSEEVMKKILYRIDSHIENGRTVYVHCWAGMGRTGTVIGCYLMRHGLANRRNVMNVLTRLRKVSCDVETHVQSYPQAEMVENWKIGM